MKLGKTSERETVGGNYHAPSSSSQPQADAAPDDEVKQSRKRPRTDCAQSSSQNSDADIEEDEEEKLRVVKHVTSTTSSSNVSSSSNKPRAFETWRKKHVWLALNSNGDAICTICCQAVDRNLLLPTGSRNIASKKAFVTEGFSCWKNAAQRFNNHERSEFHLCAFDSISNAKEPSVAEKISDSNQKDMRNSRIALEKIFGTVTLLARQGLPLRGDGNDENSHLMQFLQMRAEDVPELKVWLQRKTGRKWLHHDIINEILQSMANEVLCDKLVGIKAAKYYAIIVDETSDVSRTEQVSFSVRIVLPDLIIEETFLGFYETRDTKSDTLVQIIRDILIRFQLNIADLRGQCYDGAANMSGKIRGVQAQILQEESRALYVHCRPHTLNLVVQDTMENVVCVKNFLGIAKEVINFIRDSPKRLAEFKDLLSEDALNLSPFCPTRWCVRVKSLKRMHHKDTYDALLIFFEDKQKDKQIDKTACSKAGGLLKSMDSFEFYYLLTLVIAVLERVEILTAELQKCELSVSESHDKIRLVTEHLKEIRSSGFQDIWSRSVEGAKELGLPEPKVPRVRQRSTRIDTGSHTAHAFSNPEEYYRKVFYELLDQVLVSLHDRFECKTSKLLDQFEAYVTGKNSNVSVIMSFFKDDFDENSLVLHQQMFLSQVKIQKVTIKSLTDVVDYLKVNSNLCDFIPEFMKLIRIILTIPSSSCTAERSFSALRRLKTYLRASMTAHRLNHIAVLHIHADIVDKCLTNNLTEIVNKFILKNSLRKSTFAIIKK